MCVTVLFAFHQILYSLPASRKYNSELFRRSFGNVSFKNWFHNISSLQPVTQPTCTWYSENLMHICYYFVREFVRSGEAVGIGSRQGDRDARLARSCRVSLNYFDRWIIKRWFLFGCVYNICAESCARKNAHVTRASVWVQSAARCSAERGESPRVPLACLPACAEVRVQWKCKACALSCADDTATRAIASLCSSVWYAMFLGLWVCDKV